MRIKLKKFQLWHDYCDQGSSQSSNGGFSIGAPTPSPSPLTPNVLKPYERPASPIEAKLFTSATTATSTPGIDNESYKYVDIYDNHSNNMKFMPMQQELHTDITDIPLHFLESSGISPLKDNLQSTRNCTVKSPKQFIKTRTYD